MFFNDKWIFILAISLVFSCSRIQPSVNEDSGVSAGKLLMCGQAELIWQMHDSLNRLAKTNGNRTMIVLILSQKDRDSMTNSEWYRLPFLTNERISTVKLYRNKALNTSQLDSIKNAPAIWLYGDETVVDMDIDLIRAIRYAYAGGSLILGSGFGAMVMGGKYIAGSERDPAPEKNSFKTIGANEILIKRGLGLVPSLILDFNIIVDLKMNRLISVCLENPEKICFGIEHSTAILMQGNMATVLGSGQLIVLRHNANETTIYNGMLGAKNIELSVYLPGESFNLRK